MLTIQILSMLVSGFIAYYVSRSGPYWKIVPALALAMIGGWLVGMTAALIGADGNTAAIGRSLGAAFWFTVVGTIGGICFGRVTPSQPSVASKSDACTAASKCSEENSRDFSTDRGLKVARLEASLGKYKSDVLAKAKKVCSENPSLLIDDVYVFFRSKELDFMANVSPTAPDNAGSNSSSGRTGQIKAEQSDKTPPKPIMYVVTTLVVAGAIAIYGSDHIKRFVADFMGPTKNEAAGGGEQTARPAGGEQAAGSGWHICNNSAESRVYIAISLLENNEWRKRGWLEVSRGNCETITSRIEKSFVYYYAEGSERVWSGDHGICVHPRKQFDYGSEILCPSGFEVYGFREVYTDGSARHVTELMDQ